MWRIQIRSSWLWWLPLVLMLTLVACTRGAGTPPPTPRPRFTLPPTFTPLPPPPTPTRRPTPTAEPGLSASATLASPTTPLPSVTPLPSPTPTATEPVLTFYGWCHPGIAGPCLYTLGTSKYQGEVVYRYVFENLPFPQYFFLEINGSRLDCITREAYPTRAYCLGGGPERETFSMRLGLDDGQTVIEFYIPPEVLQDMAQSLPIGTPTPKPTPTGRGGGGGDGGGGGGTPYP